MTLLPEQAVLLGYIVGSGMVLLLWGWWGFLKWCIRRDWKRRR